ncbi:MAG: sirohydrochlorin chelatase [Limnohabitans sp.]
MKAIVLFAHGSRDPQWHLPMVAVKERIGKSHPDTRVACAYLELSTPDLPTAVAAQISQGVTDIRVVPMFLGVGKHVRHDLPLMMDELKLQYPHIRFECLPAVGEHPELLDLLAKIAWVGSQD